MTDPILSIRASGFGGRGYALPTRPDENGKPTKYPGITTVISALDKGGVVQWAVDQTAAYAVANAAALSERDEDWGFRSLRFYHSRKPDYDDPQVNIHNYHTGVLDDLAEQGNIIHAAVEAYVKDEFGPAFTRPEQEEAFVTFLDWADENVDEFLASEATVFNPEAGYAGTGDLWVRLKDGRVLYLDVKTSRKVHDSHIMQGAAILKAGIRIEESETGVEFKGKHWIEVDALPVEAAGILQVRPRSVDEYGNDIPAFCQLHEIPHYEVEPAYQQFLGALQARRGQAALREARNAAKKREKNGDFW